MFVPSVYVAPEIAAAIVPADCALLERTIDALVTVGRYDALRWLARITAPSDRARLLEPGYGILDEAGALKPITRLLLLELHAAAVARITHEERRERIRLAAELTGLLRHAS